MPLTGQGRAAAGPREVALLLRLRLVAASFLMTASTALLDLTRASRWTGAFCAGLGLCVVVQFVLRVSSWSAGQRADRALIQLAVLLPSLNLVFYHHMPGFDVSRPQWMPLLLIFKTLVGTIGLSLPPMHTLLHITVSAAILGYLEFERCCKLAAQQRAEAGFANDPMLAPFIVTKVLPMYLVCLAIAAAAVNSALTLDDASKLQDVVCRQTDPSSATSEKTKTWDYISHLADPDPPLPLECLGITVFRRLGARPVLLHYHRLVLWVCLGIGRKVNLMCFVCVPIALHYTTLLVLMRFQPALANTYLAPECLLTAMACVFVLGQETTKIDTVAALQAFQSQLAASHALLMDQWPAHVVRAILNRVSCMSLSRGGAESSRHHAHEELVDSHDEPPLPPPPQQQQQQQPGKQGLVSQADKEAVPNAELPCDEQPSGLSGRIKARLTIGDLLGPLHQDAVPVIRSQSCVVVTEACARQQNGNEAEEVMKASSISGAASTLNHATTAPARSISGALTSYMLRAAQVAPRDLSWSWLGERLCSSTGVAEEGELAQQRSRPPSMLPEDRDVMAASHECVTICLLDICGFSTWAGKVEPAKVLHTLDCLYTKLDDVILSEFPSLYKIETIGDAYIVAANLLVPDPDHAATAVRFAVRAREEASKVPRPDVDDGSTLQTRIGLHSGSISSGIVGKIRRRYVVYGDAMNLASRTETTCPPGCIQLTAATYELAVLSIDKSISLTERGEVQVKGREQPLLMFLATRKMSEGSVSPEGDG